MTTYYKATFPDGTVHTRSTVTRAYVACARGTFTWTPESGPNKGKQVTRVTDTWCAKEERARAEAGRWTAQGRSGEWAPAVEIDAKEYRALKQAAVVAATARQG